MKTDNSYCEKGRAVESKILEIYNRFGMSQMKIEVQKCIEVSLNQLMSGTLGDKVYQQISRVVVEISRDISSAAGRLAKGSGKVKLLGAIASAINRVVKAADFIKNFAQLCNICQDFYEHLESALKKLEANTNDQIRNKQLVINQQQIAEEKVAHSFGQ